MKNINTNEEDVETLSDEVKAFYTWNTKSQCSNKSKVTKNCLDPKDGLLDWNVINSWMCFEGLEDEQIDEILSNYELCLDRVSSFHDILCAINDREPVETELIEKYTSWTGRSDDIKLLVNEENNKMVLLEQILLFSSTLEFSLGNVFYSQKGLNPPYLFKDLLKSTKVKEVFGSAIPFIRYVLGTPVSVNLRNIAWHGFLSLKYLTDDLPKLLLLIILSLGRDLTVIGHLKINFRPFSTSSEKFVCLKSDLKNFLSENETLVETQENVYLSHMNQLHKKGYYGRSLQLLLIQIEAHVRHLYYKTHPGFDPKARINGYYFTMDMILDQNVCVGTDSFEEMDKNSVKDLLNDTALSLFYDCFVSLNGPRIRDRMSHGELRLTDVSKSAFETIFYLFNSLSDERGSKNHCFESYFHPISELKRKLREIEGKIECLGALLIPEELKNDQINIENFKINQIKVVPIQLLRDPDFIHLSKFIRALCRIIDNCLETTTNYLNALNQRLREFVNRTLSQPRRKTLINMLSIRLKVIEGIVVCSNIVTIYCQDVKTIKFEAKKQSKELKEILKVVENLKVQLSIDKNDWKRASEGVLSLVSLSKNIKNHI